MGKLVFVICLLTAIVTQPCAFGELQNVQVGGSIEIAGTWYNRFWTADDADAFPWQMPLRAIGPNGTTTYLRTDGRTNDYTYGEERTRLHVSADFTDNAMAFIELDNISTWGGDFRSDYVTGQDYRGAGGVSLYQAYIEAQSVFGIPLQLRIGRQEMLFGTGWLVGMNTWPDPFLGLSFDAVRLTWAGENYAVDAWASKLAENSPIEADGDIDFYGVNAKYSPAKDIDVELFWMLVRDARSQFDTAFGPFSECIEHGLGLDNYDATQLHTVGFRFAGTRGAWDWDLEGAYQFGEADALGAGFRSSVYAFGSIDPALDFLESSLYGDDGASWDAFAGMFDVGYTIGCAWSPRLYIIGQYYSGEDKRSVSFLESLNPFRKPKASVSFNRLFSDMQMDYFIDASALSNIWTLQTGFSATPTEEIEVGLDIIYIQAVEPFDAPLAFHFFGVPFPVAPALEFLAKEGSKDIGWQITPWVKYAYSKDLSFEAGWSHFFVGDGLADGVYCDENGLRLLGGFGGTRDADRVYFITRIAFGGTGNGDEEK
jgi:hypothetical protein